jgi:hypothetical protein
MDRQRHDADDQPGLPAVAEAAEEAGDELRSGLKDLGTGGKAPQAC